jgi:hypothetical protein
MERNALKERLMNKDDKNGAKKMGHVKMAGPGSKMFHLTAGNG